MMTKKTVSKTAKTKIQAACRKIEKPRRKRVTFQFEGKPGVDVRLAGSFNGWDPAAHPLSPVKGNGTYVATLLLLPGSHEYKFVVDGQWVNDSRCTDLVLNGHGTQNSVIEIR